MICMLIIVRRRNNSGAHSGCHRHTLESAYGHWGIQRAPPHLLRPLSFAWKETAHLTTTILPALLISTLPWIYPCLQWYINTRSKQNITAPFLVLHCVLLLVYSSW